MPDSAQVYAKHLLSGRGYPLWTPEPSIQLLLYRPDGLRIGDVGVVNPVNGNFDVFFNICLPRNHPFHRATGVPDNFTHVTPLDIDFATHPTAENAGCVISTPSITQDETPRTDEVSSRGVPSSLNYEFRLPSTEGALLILPQGAESHELRNLDIFEDVAARNGIEWYDYAKRRRGRMISDDALYLISGFHKASSFSLASFQNTKGSGEFSARFRATQVGPAHVATTYTWQTTRSLDWRVGPTDGGNGFPNQAVFIRGFKIAIRQGILGKRIAVDVDCPTVRPQPSKFSRTLEHRSPLAKVSRAKISGARSTDVQMQNAKLAIDLDSPTSTQSGSGVSADSDCNVADDSLLQVHPSDVINRYLLNKAPSAPIAITHDSIWGSMLENGLVKIEDFRQDSKLEKILSTNFQLVSQDDAVFLENIEQAFPPWTTQNTPDVQDSGQGGVGADIEIPSDGYQDIPNVTQSSTEFVTHDEPEDDNSLIEVSAVDGTESPGPSLTSLEHHNSEPASALRQISSLCRLPTSVLEQVVLVLNEDHMHPSQILPLLTTCKEVYLSLGFKTNHHLYAQLFLLYFDSTAAIRRHGASSLYSQVLSTQLRANWISLRTINRGDIYADGVLSSFWNCFRMMTENDGKNRFHLDAAGLPDFVDRFVCERLYEDSAYGWPAENEINSLAMWLLWFTSTRDRLTAESTEKRNDVTRLVLPYVLMPVRYASYYAPPTYFTFPIPVQASYTYSSVAIHGPYPPTRKSLPRKMMFYNHTDSVVGVPLASLAAKLVYFSRREILPVGVPPHLPRTRQHAMELGLTVAGPTQEDVQELNNHRSAKLVQNTVWDRTNETEFAKHSVQYAPSTIWDDDWNRLVDCNSPSFPIPERLHYSPGLLTGLWHGRMLYPDGPLYADIMLTLEKPSTLSEQTFGLTSAPVYVRLREYHCMDVDSMQPIPTGQDDTSGFTNAWFPNPTRFQNVENGLLITSQGPGGSCVYNEYAVGGPDLHDENKCRRCRYRRMSDIVLAQDDSTYLALADSILAEEARNEEGDAMDVDITDDDHETTSKEDSDLVVEHECNGILDIVLIGETDDRHGQAWHHFKYYGRVREWDGLVALVRVPTRQLTNALGVWVFTGYVIGGQNFVGNWRTMAHPGEPVTQESAFVMSKCDSLDGDMCDRV